MTKAQIVTKIAKNTGLDKDAVMTVVEQFMDCVATTLADGDTVHLRNFGNFVLKKRAAKLARNISRNTAMLVPEHQVPVFKASKSFIEEINGGPIEGVEEVQA